MAMWLRSHKGKWVELLGLGVCVQQLLQQLPHNLGPLNHGLLNKGAGGRDPAFPRGRTILCACQVTTLVACAAAPRSLPALTRVGCALLLSGTSAWHSVRSAALFSAVVGDGCRHLRPVLDASSGTSGLPLQMQKGAAVSAVVRATITIACQPLIRAPLRTA